MESDTVLGIGSSLLIFGWHGWLVVRFAHTAASGRAFLKHAFGLVTGPLVAWAATYVVWRFFNTVDASDGPAALLVPVLVAFSSGTLSLLMLVMVLVVRRNHPPTSLENDAG